MGPNSLSPEPLTGPKEPRLVVVEKVKRRPTRPTSGAQISDRDASSISAETEISDDPPPLGSSDDPFDLLLAACDNFAAGQCVFQEADDRIRNALIPAYALFCAIKSDKALHRRLIAHLKDTRGRRRKGSLNRPALNATVAACHPKDVAADKRCSDWGNLLAWANLEKVRAEDFAAWVVGRSIADAKFKIRQVALGDKPRDHSGRRILLPFKEHEYPRVVQALSIGDVRLLELARNAFARMEAFLDAPPEAQRTEPPARSTDAQLLLADAS